MTAKPPYGSACNRCGLCCQVELCPLGQHVFKREAGPCPALEWKPEGAACGLMLNPFKYAPRATAQYGSAVMAAAARDLNGAGVGCDAHMPPEPDNPEYSARLREGIDWKKSRAALRLWGF